MKKTTCKPSRMYTSYPKMPGAPEFEPLFDGLYFMKRSLSFRSFDTIYDITRELISNVSRDVNAMSMWLFFEKCYIFLS